MTTTMYENGNTYQLTYKEVDDKPVNPESDYITINSHLFEVISKVQINDFTVPESMHLGVIKNLDENTKVSLHYLPDLIKDLTCYDDEYSKKLLTVFCNYQDHKDFDKMSAEIQDVKPDDKRHFLNIWHLNTRLSFLECTLPM